MNTFACGVCIDHTECDVLETLTVFNHALPGIMKKRGMLKVDVSVGFCVPRQCTEKDINILLPYMMGLVNDIMPYQYSELNQNDQKGVS